MATCFIFAKYLTDEGCLCLVLNQQGDVETPLAQCNFHEIQQLQVNATTVVVLSTSIASIFRIALPWLPEKKARAAIPFALEDKLSENVSELHFAFDRSHYHNGHYLVVVCNKSIISLLVEAFDRHNLNFDIMTLDWFALENNEACVMDTNVLVHNNLVFNGSLAPELALTYLNDIAEEQTVYRFPDSGIPVTATNMQMVDIASSLWIAQRLKNLKLLNLCQGQLQHGNSKTKTRRWYWAAMSMSLIWLLTLLVINSMKIQSLNVQTKTIDAEIATVYRHFFPDAKQIISPKFRITQLLKSRKNDGDNAFWVLLNELTQAGKINQSEVQQLRYQNQIMHVTVTSKDFDSLEALQTFLKKAEIQVRQSQASTKDDKVVGTLELNL